MIDGSVLDRMLHGEASDPRTYLMALGYKPPHLAARATNAKPLPVQVNHGIWIALDGCEAQEGVFGGGVVWLDDPVIWCPLCSNRATGRKWRPVALPAEREAIEAVLSVRPEENRNWVPGETVDDLLVENAAHGLEAG
jgi:hypothetical protein